MTLLDQTEIQIQYDDLIHHQFKKPIKRHQDRSKGVHLSDILKYLYFGSLPPAIKDDKKALKNSMLNASDDLESPFDPTVMPLKMVLGMAFEAFTVGFYPDLEWQPKEMLLDGIAGSRDGTTWANYDDIPIIEEFKLTWKSSRDRLGEKFMQESLWMWQGKGYVHQYDRTCNKVPQWTPRLRFHVCWINGDYTHPYQPKYTTHLIEFEQPELESFWQRAILPNKRQRYRMD